MILIWYNIKNKLILPTSGIFKIAPVWILEASWTFSRSFELYWLLLRNCGKINFFLRICGRTKILLCGTLGTSRVAAELWQLNDFSHAELWQLPSFSNLRNYGHFLRNYDRHPPELFGRPSPSPSPRTSLKSESENFGLWNPLRTRTQRVCLFTHL
jgi:hypothetical protein